ncbi:MAG: peptidase M14 [Thermoanaerobaculia bacterium]|nr:MAG: peptidase M14 [Thermoanaerobaculia bacterium]
MSEIRSAGFTLALLCALVLAAPLAGAATPSDPFAGDGPWMVRAWFGDQAMLRVVASWGDHYRIDRKSGYLSIEADPVRVAELRALGFFVEVDEELTSWIRHAEAAQARARERAARGEAPEAGIPGFPCYRTVEETFTSAQALVTAHPTLAAIVDAGDSWEKATAGGLPGYDMLVLKLTNSAIPGPKPKFFATTAIHAREYTTAELAMRFAEGLVNGYGTDADATWLLDHHEVHLMLHTNPDGRKHAEGGDSWRKNTNGNYCGPTSSSRGADLNRNFNFQWACCGGSSGSECDDTFRGGAPGSEPETQAVQSYLLANFPDQRGPNLTDPAPVDATGVYLDIHSYSELVLWPWGFTSTTAPNATALQTLGRKFAYFNGYYPEQSIGLYPTDGTTDDYGYGILGVASYCFELGTSFFQNCSTFESSILPGNLPALSYAAKTARTPYMTPAGPDALAVAVAPGVIAPGDAVDVTATFDDTRYSNAHGAEPTQAIAAAEVYVGTPPWAGGTPVAMSADDGAFNETIEPATGTLDSGATAGLASGRHLVYVRGRDAANNWGAVSAAFLTVIDPATAPIVEGTVTEAGTGTPLAATVTVGPYATATDPGTGAYSIQVPAGTYDLTASSAGHASATFSDVTLVAQQTLVQDFELMPYTVALDDDVEGGNIGWTPGGVATAWAITTAQSHSPTHSWTDSPAGSYVNNSDTWLTSPLLNLTGATDTVLSFWHRYDTESGYDYCLVQVSTNGGSTWTDVASYDGSQTAWQAVTIPVPQLDGVANARVRFRLTTDVSVTRDGWYVDDIVVQAVPPQAPQAMAVSVVGSGTVTSSPPGISCPSDCGESYAYGTPVVLTAAPAPSWSFTGWSGDCSGTGTCNLTMSAAHAVTATFVFVDPMPFLDGFESGDTSAWSATVP